MTQLQALAGALREGRGLAHKRDIAAVASALRLPAGIPAAVPLGDDCAAIPDGDGGHLLLAIEGFLDDFVAAEPWFAGYCGAMVNLSDVYAMGGRPLAVVDALWSRDGERGRAILDGLVAASRAYGVPIVGGHSNSKSTHEGLAVAVLGRAGRRVLSSFAARPGERLVAAVDLRGRYREPYPYWDASTTGDAPAERLRGDLELLPLIAEAGLCAAAKDVSMGGLVGTALMLLECSGLGGILDVGAVPTPPGVAPERWLGTFPSYGFLLSVPEEHVTPVVERFRAREIACAAVGSTDDTGVLRLADGSAEVPFWNLRETPLLGCGPAAA